MYLGIEIAGKFGTVWFRTGPLAEFKIKYYVKKKNYGRHFLLTRNFEIHGGKSERSDF